MADTWKIVRNLWDTFDNNPANQRTVDAMKGMLGLLPAGAGDVASGLLAADDVRRGDYTSAALNGVGVLPFIPSMAGMVKGKGDDIAKAIKPTKYEQAHEVARKNAVKMLGLPESNTAMDRAKALGYTTDAYHGTHVWETEDGRVLGDIYSFDKMHNQKAFPGRPLSVDNLGTWVSDHAGETGAGMYSRGDHSPGVIYPLMIKSGNQWNTSWDGLKHTANRVAGLDRDEPVRGEGLAALNKWIQSNEIDSVALRKQPGEFADQSVTIIPNPENIRSRFAAFDPARINEPDLLGRVNPELLPWLTGAGLLGAGGMYYSGE